MDRDDPDELLRTGGGLDLFNEIKQAAAQDFAGRVLGDYRLVEQIGEGGMSHVYRSKRIDGRFDRDVAIKLSPIGGFNRELRTRFLREQAILASMIHPNVAQLFDAGVTEEGWPYIVMELVEGVSIERFADEQDLGPRAVVQLVQPLVDAVAFAHARLIVHRDIKPSNVLVNKDGRPQLLDFGIAKLLEPDSTELTDLRPMTVSYASPEQLLGHPITVATDIYQLGLLLHRLLLRKPAHSDGSLSEALERVTARRPFTMDAVDRQRLPRDLAAILERCLQTDAAERYRDANSLRDDLLRYIDRRPVLATSPTPAYRLAMFVARNKAASTVALLSMATIVGGSLFYTWQVTEARDVAQRESRTAEAVVDFLVQTYRAPDPRLSRGADITAREMLENGLSRVETELADQPEIQAEMRFTLGDILFRLGEFPEAQPALEAASDYFTSRIGPAGIKTLNTQWILASNHISQGNYDTGVAMAQAALELQHSQHPEAAELRVSLLTVIASGYNRTGQFPLSQQAYEEAIEIAESSGMIAEENRFNLGAGLGHLMNLAGKPQEAVRVLEPLLPKVVEAHGKDYRLTSDIMTNLADAYSLLNRTEEAVQLFSEVVPIREAVLGPHHRATLNARANLATTLMTHSSLRVDSGVSRTEVLADFERASALLENVRQGLASELGEDHGDALQAGQNHALSLVFLERYDAAIESLLEIRGRAAAMLPTGHQVSRDSDRFLGYAYFMAGRPVEARPILLRALTAARKAFGDDFVITKELTLLVAEVDAQIAQSDSRDSPGK
ncbi:MAG: serine/threonine-protein kinase [Pseudomonadota bacterium]